MLHDHVLETTHNLHHHHDQLATLLSVQNMFDFTNIALIFSFSFFASFHCAFMCGPIALAATRGGFHTSRSRVGMNIFIYNFTRGIGYILAGVAVSILSETISFRSERAQKLTALSISFVLFAIGMRIIFFSRGNFFPSTTNSVVQEKLTELVGYIRSRSPQMLSAAVGILTVGMPCFTLTPALVAAAGASSWIGGGLTMAAFFAGTLPVMIAALG